MLRKVSEVVAEQPDPHWWWIELIQCKCNVNVIFQKYYGKTSETAFICEQALSLEAVKGQSLEKMTQDLGSMYLQFSWVQSWYFWYESEIGFTVQAWAISFKTGHSYCCFKVFPRDKNINTLKMFWTQFVERISCQ